MFSRGLIFSILLGLFRYSLTFRTIRVKMSRIGCLGILFSVCTCAFLLAAAGVLPGLTVTTHHHALDKLRNLCSRVHGDQPPTQIVCRRFVDGGFLHGTRVQVITSGGISSGLDVTFYLICHLNAEIAAHLSRVMEYGWTETDDRAWPIQFDALESEGRRVKPIPEHVTIGVQGERWILKWQKTRSPTDYARLGEDGF